MRKHDWHKGMKKSDVELAYRGDIVRYIEDQFVDEDTKKTVRLAQAQKAFIREATRKNENDAMIWNVVAYTALKKSFKTGLTAARGIWTALRPEQDIYFIGRSKEQARDRGFSMLVDSLKYNEYPKIRKQSLNSIEFTNGSTIKCLPCTLAVAGINYNLVCLTEGWSWFDDLHHVVWSELAVPPARRDVAAIHVDSYAGHTDIPSIISELWKKVVRNNEPMEHPQYPDVFFSKENILYIQDQLPRLSFQTPEYYAGQKIALNPPNYARQCMNKHVPSTWRGEDDSPVKTISSDFNINLKNYKLSAGLDMAMSDDMASLCILAVDIDNEKAYEVETVAFNPPIAFTTVEKEVSNAYEKYGFEILGLDIWQTGYLAQKLEYARAVSQANGRKVGDTLTYNWLRAGKLQLIKDGNVEAAHSVVTCKAVGEDYIRFTKSRRDMKIDPLVACSMALYTAIYPNKTSKKHIKEEGLVIRRGIPIVSGKNVIKTDFQLIAHRNRTQKFVVPNIGKTKVISK